MAAKVEALSVESCAVRLLDSVTAVGTAKNRTAAVGTERSLTTDSF